MHKSLIFLFSKGLILKIFWCLHCGFRLLLELNRCILGFNSIGNSYSIDGVLIPFMEFLQFILLGNCTETVLGLFITGGDIDWGMRFLLLHCQCRGRQALSRDIGLWQKRFPPESRQDNSWPDHVCKLSGRFLVNTLVI